jgi:hypothetical protein
VHLLFQIGVFILKFIILEEEIVEFIFGLVIQRLKFIFGLGFLLEALDEEKYSLALLRGQVVEEVCFIGRHLNY